MTSDYGPDLVAHFLLNELRAEGHLVQAERNKWIYEGVNENYEIVIKATPITKTYRLKER